MFANFLRIRFPSCSMPFAFLPLGRSRRAEKKRIQPDRGVKRVSLSWCKFCETDQDFECWVAREAENGKGVCANRKAIKAKGLHWFWSIEHGWTEEQGWIAQWPCQMSIVLKPFYGSTRINKNGSLCNVYLPLEGCESWLMILWSRSRKIVLIQGRGTGWFRYTSPGVLSLLWRRRNRTHCGFVW